MNFPTLMRSAYFCAVTAGMAHLFMYIYRHMYKPGIRVLYAHRIIDPSDNLYSFYKKLNDLTVEEFEERLQYLNKYYNLVSINELGKIVHNGEYSKKNMIILTFDDGYHSFYKNVFPMLRKYNVPATVFLTTDCLDNDVVLLHDQLIYMIGSTGVTQLALPDLGPEVFSLKDDEERIQAYKVLSARLKKIPHAERTVIMGKLSGLLKIREEEMKRNVRMLSWEEVREMAGSGLVSFGAHTVSHPILSRVPIEQAQDEISRSKSAIEEQLKAPVRFFAYPNGKEDDFNESTKEILRESGFELAFTTVEKAVNQYDFFEMPRYGISSSEYMSRFKIRMSGAFDIYNAFRSKLKR